MPKVVLEDEASVSRVPTGVSIRASSVYTVLANSISFSYIGITSLSKKGSIGKGARSITLEDYDDALKVNNVNSRVLPLPLFSRASRLRRRRLRSSFYIT